MRSLIVLILISHFSFGQPNPQEGYPARIKAITEQLKTDSLNYKLIWERLNMKVNLMGGFGAQEDIFSHKTDSSFKTKKSCTDFNEFTAEFNKIYDHIIKLKKYDIVEEGDFYLNRIWFYFNAKEFDKAVEDAKYLRDSASYSRYGERGDYYNNWALYALFNLHVINNNYKEALSAIDTMLEKKKRDNPEVYFSGHGSFLSDRDKISLFEHFNKTDKIIPFLKTSCIEHFNWYFENTQPNDYYANAAKEQGFELLKLTIDYMKIYGDKQLINYEKIYEQLSYRMNGTYETINPSIEDSKLKSIISGIK